MAKFPIKYLLLFFSYFRQAALPNPLTAAAILAFSPVAAAP